MGNRPAGVTAEGNALVQAALAAARKTGHQPSLTTSSTDSNLPISLGIPAITIGGGGRSDNAHSLDGSSPKAPGAARRPCCSRFSITTLFDFEDPHLVAVVDPAGEVFLVGRGELG